ncbi:MAG: four helix bundle protein [Cephaloticoccus sp.]|nr:four helix bundle protein [Cephaloticoccus sp.]
MDYRYQRSAVSYQLSSKSAVKNYRDLAIWERSHALTLKVYAVTNAFPKDELFGLTSQIRRAVVSIPANIAEGCGRDSDAELKRFLDIAHGSASEVEYFLILTKELGYMPMIEAEALSTEIGQIKRMLGAFSRKLKADR